MPLMIFIHLGTSRVSWPGWYMLCGAQRTKNIWKNYAACQIHKPFSEQLNIAAQLWMVSIITLSLWEWAVCRTFLCKSLTLTFSSSVIFICTSIISDVMELCVCSFRARSSSVLLFSVSVCISSLCFSCFSFSWDSSREDCNLRIWDSKNHNHRLENNMTACIHPAVYQSGCEGDFLGTLWAH